MANYEQFILLVVLTAVAMAAAVYLGPTAAWLLALIAAGLISAGIQSLIADHPRFRDRPVPATPRLWLLPVLLVWSGMLLVLELKAAGVEGYLLGLGLLLVTLLYAVLLWTIYRSFEPAGLGTFASLAAPFTTYFVAFAVFTAVHASDYAAFGLWTQPGLIELDLGSLESMLAVAITSAVLALLVLDHVAPWRRAATYAVVVAVLMAEVAWGFGHWSLDALTAGAFLLLSFYSITSVLRAHLAGRLGRALLWEMAIASGFGLVLLYIARHWAA